MSARKIFLILTACLTINTAYTQDKFTIGLYSGASFPLNDLSSTEYTVTTTGGFAKTGYLLDAELKYFFSDYVGVGVASTRKLFSVNTDLWSDKAFEPQSDSIVEIYAAKWSLQDYSGLLLFRYPIGEYFDLTATAGAGYLIAIVPEAQIEAVLLNGKYLSFLRESVSGSSVQYQASLGVKYYFDESFAFNSSINYTTSRVEVTYQGKISPEVIHLSTLNIKFGVVYNFL